MTAETTPSVQDCAAVDQAITSRRSIRAYLPTPVPRQTVEEILAVASRAPSGTNTPPLSTPFLRSQVVGKGFEFFYRIFGAFLGSGTWRIRSVSNE